MSHAWRQRVACCALAPALLMLLLVPNDTPLPPPPRSHPTALEAARALSQVALERWAVETAGLRADDITVVVAFLPA